MDKPICERWHSEDENADHFCCWWCFVVVVDKDVNRLELMDQVQQVCWENDNNGQMNRQLFKFILRAVT